MTISTTTAEIVHDGDGSNKSFSFPFLIPDSDSYSLILTDSSGAETEVTTNFSISGIGDSSGGTVTYPSSGAAISANEKFSIQRTVPYTQETKIRNLRRYDPQTVEDALDRLCMQIQQVKDITDRCVQISISDDEFNSTEFLQEAQAAVSLALAAQAAAEAAETKAEAAETNAEAAKDAAVAAASSLDERIVVAVTNETSDLSTNTGLVTFRMPLAMTLTEVRANVNTAPAGSSIIVDINESGSTILSTKLSIDSGEKTSETAATPAVISDAALADDAEITIDIDQVGSGTAGKGLKVTLIGERV